MKFTTTTLIIAIIVTLKGVESGVTPFFASSDSPAEMGINTNRLPLLAVDEDVPASVELPKPEEPKKVAIPKRKPNKRKMLLSKIEGESKDGAEIANNNTGKETKPVPSQVAKKAKHGGFFANIKKKLSELAGGFKRIKKPDNDAPKKDEPKKLPPTEKNPEQE